MTKMIKNNVDDNIDKNSRVVDGLAADDADVVCEECALFDTDKCPHVGVGGGCWLFR